MCVPVSEHALLVDPSVVVSDQKKRTICFNYSTYSRYIQQVFTVPMYVSLCVQCMHFVWPVYVRMCELLYITHGTINTIYVRMYSK